MIIMTLVDYYLPGYKGGGPIRTLSNMVERLGQEFPFMILTRDRDIGESEPYLGVHKSWVSVGQAQVQYLAPPDLSCARLLKIINSTKFDILYLNSFFSIPFTIKPLLLRKLGLLTKCPVVVAPRGELASGALGIKHLKKKIYIFLAKRIGLYEGVTWQASTLYEAEDIRRWLGNKTNIVIAVDIPGKSNNCLTHQKRKKSGQLKMVFLSRVARSKNLRAGICFLKNIIGNVELDIYGPIEDAKYWDECIHETKKLPVNVKVKYCGEVPHNKVIEVMKQYDVFYLPTLGENYGHVIHEALMAGCPIIVSDQTPWKNLEDTGIGWDISLDYPEIFTSTIQNCINMDPERFAELSSNAANYAIKRSNDQTQISATKKLFSDVAKEARSC